MGRRVNETTPGNRIQNVSEQTDEHPDHDNSKPLEIGETDIKKKISFAKGTKPPMDNNKQRIIPIYRGGRLQECVGGRNKTVRAKRQYTEGARRTTYVHGFSNRKAKQYKIARQ